MEIKCDFLANNSCEVRQADDIIIPEYLGLGVDRPEFFMAFAIEFVLPPAYQAEDEDDYLLLVPDVKRHSTFHQIWAPCMFLQSNNMPWKEISKLLTRFKIPLHKQPFMVHRIAACADEMVNKVYNKIRRVLRIWVSITVAVDYCVTEQEHDHTSCIKKARNFSDLDAVPANEASIKALERVTIEQTEPVTRCMVCLEELQADSEARRMPCKHVYHQTCIFSWLRVAGFCPICHVYLPA